MKFDSSNFPTTVVEDFYNPVHAQNLVLEFKKITGCKNDQDFIAVLNQHVTDNTLSSLVKEFSNSKEFDYFKKIVQSHIEEKFQTCIKEFPINIVRIVINNHDGLVPWHQDEATWMHVPSLSGKYPITAWTPLWYHNAPAGIELLAGPEPCIYPHTKTSNNYTTGYFSSTRIPADTEPTIKSSNKIGSITLFSSNTLHRSMLPVDHSSIRMSCDIRFNSASALLKLLRRCNLGG